MNGESEGQKEFEGDIYVSSNNTNTALNGDTVLVEIFDKSTGKRTEGRVLQILKREKTKAVGTYQKSKNFGFVVPDDKRFGTDIFISKNDSRNARDRQKVVVEITKYPENR